MPRRWARARRVRQLLPLWVVREVKAQYRQSTFDLGWSLLTPVLTVAGYGLVLTTAFGVEGDGVPYIAFAWTGVVVWTFVANGLLRGATSLVVSADLVRKVSFPKEVVPIATVLSSGLDLAIGLAVLAILMVVQGIPLSIHVIGIVPVMAATLVWTVALAIIFATITSFVRDLAHGLGVILRIGIFVTPVMYPASQVPEQYRWLLSINPISVFIEDTRAVLLRQAWPDWDLLGAHALVALILLLVSLAYLRRVEGRIADVI